MKYNKIITILSFIFISSICYSSDIVTGMSESDALKQGKHLESKASLGNRVIYKFSDCVVKCDNGIVIRVDFRNLTKEQIDNKHHEEAAIKQKQLDEQRVKQNLIDNANNVISAPPPPQVAKSSNSLHETIKSFMAEGHSKDETLKNAMKLLPIGAEIKGNPVFEDIPHDQVWTWTCTIYFKVNE